MEKFLANRLDNLYCTDDIELAKNSPFVVTPQTLYRRQSFSLPLSDAELAEFFGAETSLLEAPRNDPDTNRTSTFLQTDTVPCPFLLRGIAVQFKVEPLQWALTGEAIVAPGAATPTPAFGGSVPFSADAAAPRPATLEWGKDAVEAAVAFALAYRFRLKFGCDIIAMDESVADIGYIGEDNCMTGYGHSMIAAHEYIASVNAQARTMEADRIFVPQTVDTSTVPSTALPPPLVPATYGGPCMPGTYGGFFPIRYPVMLMPGIPIQAEFFRDPGDTLWHNRLVQALGIHEETLTYDEFLTEVIAGDLGFAGSIRFKGGLISWSLVFKGWRLMNKACVEFFNQDVWGLGLNGAPRDTPLKPELVDTYSSFVGNLAAKENFFLAGPQRASTKQLKG